MYIYIYTIYIYIWGYKITPCSRGQMVKEYNYVSLLGGHSANGKGEVCFLRCCLKNPSARQCYGSVGSVTAVFRPGCPDGGQMPSITCKKQAT